MEELLKLLIKEIAKTNELLNATLVEVQEVNTKLRSILRFR